MAGVLVDNGESQTLQYLVNKAAPENLVLKLFKNNHTPIEADTVSAYTEATFTGYSAITLTGSDWTVSGSAPKKISTAAKAFTSSADQTTQTIFGYYLVGATSANLYAAELFASSVPVTNNGDVVNVTASITAHS